jgi:ferredoxin
MPTLTVEGYAPVAIDNGTRLVNAIEQGRRRRHSARVRGQCPLTTCRIEFISGEPARMTQAEQAKLAEKGLSGVRLSCQIECDHDMTVKVLNHLAGSGRPDPGKTPEPTIQPPPVWV